MSWLWALLIYFAPFCFLSLSYSLFFFPSPSSHCLTLSQSSPQHKAPPDLPIFEGFRVFLLRYFLHIHYPTQHLSSLNQESSTYQKTPAPGMTINNMLFLSIPPQQTELQFPTSTSPPPHQVKVDATLSSLFKLPRRWQVQCY